VGAGGERDWMTLLLTLRWVVAGDVATVGKIVSWEASVVTEASQA
jgi:hypothetical protein